jgi:hypothetical protein
MMRGEKSVETAMEELRTENQEPGTGDDSSSSANEEGEPMARLPLSRR